MTAAAKKPPTSRAPEMRAATWAGMPRHRAAWSVGEKITTAQWAKANRVLSEKQSAEPGNWNNERTPYLVGIMDAFCDSEITDVVVMKAAQVGMSEAMRNVLGYWIDQDPGPALYVMPDEDSAKEVMAEKLGPLIRDTPCLASHLTAKQSDVGQRRILLDHMEIHAAWAGSPQSLASRPKRFVIYDEADKYPPFSGKESDPISLGNKRTATYRHRAKRGILGTPTIRSAPIFRAWESAQVRLLFHVPCPSCERYAVPAWSKIRWPSDLPGTRDEQAAEVEKLGLAWYECECGAKITERQRAALLRRGRWAPEGFSVDPNGPARQGVPKGTRQIAFHVPATISPWVLWSEMAAAFLRAIGSESKMMDWRNSFAGEPYEVRASSIKSDAFDSKMAAGYPSGVVPSWAGMLLASADTQKHGFWYVVRAWGHAYRSRLIVEGFAETFADLRAKTLDAFYANEDANVAAMAPHMLAIDSGGGSEAADSDLNLTDQVYQFVLTDPARIVAIKGYGGARELETPIRQSFITAKAPGEKDGAKVALYLLKTGYFKDVLAARIVNDSIAADSWEIHKDVSRDYVRQMASEHKVIIRKARQQVARWVPVTSGAANHLWDAEVYNIALSQIAHAELIPPHDEITARRKLEARPVDHGERADDWASATRW
jgi:phage terminase large subunit GpA-like protein